MYLDVPTDPGNGQPLTITAYSRPDTADDHHPDVITATATLDLVGPVTAYP
ncbi:hypothetical protein GCM10010399_84000 [Dactylosporangium fulvum]